LARGNIGRHAAIDIPFRRHLEMKIHLAFHLAFE
jgi:hypothetical protein